MRVIDLHKNNALITNVVIIFLTDGEDTSIPKNRRNELVTALKSNIKLEKPYTVHTIGFTNLHDFEFLDNLKKIGTSEGAFRYAEPHLNDDALSSKINSLLDVIVTMNSVQIKITECKLDVIHSDNDKHWLNLTNTDLSKDYTLKLAVNNESPIEVTTNFAEDENDTKIQNEWFSYLIDEITSEIIMISKQPDCLNKQIHCELLENRSKSILIKLESESPNAIRLNTLLLNLQDIKKGVSVNQIKLTDMKSEGKFSTQISSKPNDVIPMKNQAVESHIAYGRPTWIIVNWIKQRRCIDKNNEFCKLLCSGSNNAIMNYLNEAKEIEDKYFLMAISIGRHTAIISQMIGKLTNRDIRNSNNYNALDLAVIYGYYHTFDVLYMSGFQLNLNPDILLMTCLNYGHIKTAERLISHKLAIITDDMIRDSPSDNVSRFLSEKSQKEIDVETAIVKGMYDIVEKNLNKIDKFSWSKFIRILTKPNDGHMKIIKLLVESKIADPNEEIKMINDGNDEITWPLYTTCAVGNLDLFKFFVQYTKDINKRNLGGISCLWIASCNRHPDIVLELLNHNADCNLPRTNNDSPLIAACQKGNESIVEILLTAGAKLDVYNKERDNAVLICCRGSKDKILEMIFKQLTEEERKHYLNIYAEIDGFPPLLAAAELNRVECMEVCLKYGADIEYKTNEDNKVLGGATALHLAVFYNKFPAVKLLSESKCNILAQTSSGQTVLHIAIKQGHSFIVRYLLSLPNGKQCLQITDHDGRSPAYYANIAGNEAILEEFFTNKLALCLEKILYVAPGEELKCTDTLIKYSQSLGCHEHDDIVNMNFNNSESLLTYALLNNSKHLINRLNQMGASYDKLDDYKISPRFWSVYLGLEESKDFNINVMMERLNTCKTRSIQNKMLLNLQQGMPLIEDKSEFNIAIKMNFGYDLKTNTDIAIKLYESRNQSHSILGFIDKLKKEKQLQNALFNSKVHSIKLIASGDQVHAANAVLDPLHLMVLYLYTGNLSIHKQVNENLDKPNSPNMPFILTLYQALHLLDNYTNEVYRAIDLPFTSDYKIGEVINWSTFSICSRQYKECSNLINRCKGMVFIIKSKTGKNISKYSKFPMDEEIVFLPGTKMKIIAFYKPRITAISQANIRNTTFEIGETDIEKALKGRASIIIELEEIADTNSSLI